jgi:predicted RNase H-like HicB family nuclease
VERNYFVRCEWDDDAGVWYVADSDVPGLAAEGENVEDIAKTLKTLIPELLEANAVVGAGASAPEVRFQLVFDQMRADRPRAA